MNGHKVLPDIWQWYLNYIIELKKKKNLKETNNILGQEGKKEKKETKAIITIFQEKRKTMEQN